MGFRCPGPRHVAGVEDFAVTDVTGMDQRKVEAPPGFEPGVEVLQTSALPLGDGAVKKCRAAEGRRNQA